MPGLRGYFQRVGEAIGFGVVDDMVKSGEMERIVKTAMADKFEEMADDPKYDRQKLLKMAEYIRNELKK